MAATRFVRLRQEELLSAAAQVLKACAERRWAAIFLVALRAELDVPQVAGARRAAWARLVSVRAVRLPAERAQMAPQLAVSALAQLQAFSL